MATLLSEPGSVDDPAQLGEPVTLRSDPPALFGATEGSVDLICGSQAVGIPPADVTWEAAQIIARLPTAVPSPEGPFKIRVTPAVATLGALETPIAAIPDVKAALEHVAGRLRLLVDLGDAGGPVGKAAVDVPPATLGKLGLVLTAPATIVRRAPQPRPGSPVARSQPITSGPTSGALVLEGLAPAVAQALAGADVTAEVRLVVSGKDGPLRADEVRFEPRSDVLGFGFLAAPRFVELGSSAEEGRTILVQAKVQIKATLVGGETVPAAEQLVPETPIELKLLPVGLPTVLALFRHRNYALDFEGADGFVLLVVPPGSPVAPTAKEISGTEGLSRILKVAPLDPTTGVLAVLKRLPALGPVVARVTALVEKVKIQPHLVIRAAPIDNLNEITMIEQSGIKNDTEAEKQVSSLLLLGRPGTKALLFCKRNRNGAGGQLNVELRGGNLPVGLVALSRLPEKPVPSFDALPGGLGEAAAGARITVVAPSKIKDKGSGRFVFADAFGSVDLVVPSTK